MDEKSPWGLLQSIYRTASLYHRQCSALRQSDFKDDTECHSVVTMAPFSAPTKEQWETASKPTQRSELECEKENMAEVRMQTRVTGWMMMKIEAGMT